MEPPPQQDARANRPVLWWRSALTGLIILSAPPALGSDWRYEEPFASVSDQVADWLNEPQAIAVWRDGVSGSASASRLGDALIAAATNADDRILAIVNSPDPPGWLDPGQAASASLRLAIAERLATARRYDACLAWTDGLEAEAVYSPYLLRYLRALALSQLVDDEAAREELAPWSELDPDEGAARLGAARWWVATRLLAQSKEEPSPLPTITRRMGDIQRRLSLDQPGHETQDRQQRVLDDLDKLIKELEEQRRQQQQQAAAGGAGGSGPSSPAEESRPSELKGSGQVDPKRLVKGDPWGSLPPAERERLTQAITRDLPPRYRALVEDYFRTLADGEQTPETAEGR